MDIDTENTNSSFYKYSEVGIKNRNPDLWRRVMDHSALDIPFKQKFYLFEKSMTSPPKCVCGNGLKFIDMHSGYRKFCSRRCALDCEDVKKLKKQTCLEKYGVDNPSKSTFIKEKVKKTNLEKFGVEYPLQSEEVRNRTREVFRQNYGVDNPSRMPEIRRKAEETTLSRLGVRHAMHNEDVKNRLLEYFRKKFGVDNPSMIPQIRAKAINTMLEKYGETSALKLEFFKEKSKRTNLKKWGKEYFTQTNIYQKASRERLFQRNMDIVNQNGQYSLVGLPLGEYTLECVKCGSTFNINRQLWRDRQRNEIEICVFCNPIKKNTSLGEKSLYDFIRKRYKGRVLENHRVDRKELDIFIPDLRIGFEYNGLYLHSEVSKNKSEHIDKLFHFRQRDIKMQIIWEDDWAFNREIVKSMVLNKLGIVDRKIHARKCEVRELVDNSEIRNFLNENHIQGFVGSKVKLGLFSGVELVSIMTFGGLRKAVGHSSTEGEYEMLRFCSKLNTSVVGGASKLFKFFVEKYAPTKVVSFSDNSRSSGNVYEKLGFVKESESFGGYFWFKNGIKHHRFTFRKDKLVKMGHDKEKTEVEIMHDLGYLRIWDYGQTKWVYGTQVH